MKIIDEALLDEFRSPGKCEWCGKECRAREPHHVFCRQMGGGSRLDLKLNLVSLGRWPECQCHHNAHHGKIARQKLIDLIAVREQIEPFLLEVALYALRRAPKEATLDQVGREVGLTIH